MDAVTHTRHMRRVLLVARDVAVVIALGTAGALGVAWVRYGTLPADVAGVVATMIVWAVLGLALVVAPSWIITRAIVWSWRHIKWTG